MYRGGHGLPAARVAEDDQWTLLPYQAGEAAFYLQHIAAAVDLARKDPGSLLIFSGGQTREGVALGEAVSYYQAADALGLLDDELLVRRVTTEEFSRDR